MLVFALMTATATSAQGASGDFDLSFSTDGRVQTDVSQADRINAAVPLPGGKTLAVGRAGGTSSLGSGDFVAARYLSTGELDTTFDVDGTQTIDFFGRADSAVAVVPAGTGAFVIGSAASGTPLSEGLDIAIAKLDASGQLDAGFSGDGKAIVDVASDLTFASGAVGQSDGKIVIAGTVLAPGGEETVVARITESGALDTTFSGDGQLRTKFGTASAFSGGVALDGDAIVIGGSSDGGAAGRDFAVARFTSTGAPDASFSGDGVQTTDIGADFAADAIDVGPSGRVLLAGRTSGAGVTSAAALVAYRDDGALDSSFSGDGWTTTTFGGAWESFLRVAEETNGFIVAVGSTGTMFDGPSDMAVARYRPSGALDSDFSGDGKLTIGFGPGTVSAASDFYLGTGTVTVAGRAANDLGLVRLLLTPGATDTTPPETTITTGPADGSTVASLPIAFTFSASEPGSTFTCRVDGGVFQPCSSPYQLDALPQGTHTFDVRATDPEGNTDPTPAGRSFNFTPTAAPPPPPPPPPSPPPPPPPPPEPPVVATDSKILTALGGVLVPSGKAAKIGPLLKAGYSFTFNAPVTGKLQITWYYLPKGARLAAKPKPVALATGATAVAGVGPAKITVKLNAAGRKKLKKIKSLKLTTKATFTPTGRSPLSIKRAISVRR